MSVGLLAGAQATGSRISAEQAKAVVDFHNKVRKDVGVAPLQWSNELAAYAQAWADHLAASCKISHRPHDQSAWGQKYGENIYWVSNRSMPPLAAARGWYSEIKDFRKGAIQVQNISRTGHYTQMVWKDTRKMGMGMAVCANGTVIYVANYDPPGNYIGEQPF